LLKQVPKLALRLIDLKLVEVEEPARSRARAPELNLDDGGGELSHVQLIDGFKRRAVRPNKAMAFSFRDEWTPLLI
jgi:hypothetical protein